MAAAVTGCHHGPAQPLVTSAVKESGGEGSAGFRFVEAGVEAGIGRVTHAGRPGKDHLLDSAGTGAAWLDYNRDGNLDAYIVNAWKLSGDTVIEKGRNALYRNRGDGTFEDVTDEAGVSGEGRWGSGVAVADYDDDGWPDIFVTNFGANLLYRNRGDGTFEEVAARVGIDAPGWNTGAAFFDADGDGRLDLYIARYVDCTLQDVLQATPSLDWKGVDTVALGPSGLPGGSDRFFLAGADGRFVDATRPAGLTDRDLGYGFGVRAVDIDGDRDQDLYVANDSGANYLYRNEGDGTFADVGLWSGAAYDAHGNAQAGMGVAVGDVDGDAAADLIVTNFSEDFSTLYRGDSHGFFQDVSEQAGVGPASFTHLSWGVVLSDLDNDSDLDIAIADGHIYPQVKRHPEFGLSFAQRNTLLENTGGGRFIDATDRSGPGFSVALSSRGLAAGDYDNDGDIDLLFTNLDAPPTLLRNDSPRRSWLTVICEVPPGAGPLIGTKVIITAGGRTQSRDIASSGSFLSAHDPRPHFGLGRAQVVDRLEVLWPDGTRTLRERVPANRFVTVRKPAGE